MTTPKRKTRKLYTFAEAGRQIKPRGVSRQSVDYRVKAKKIKPVEVGGNKFLTQAFVDTWNRERAARAAQLK